jgi:type IV pilus assembly protein PilX
MNTLSKYPVASQHQQSGAALIIALIMLVLITIIGFSSMQRSTLEERMTGNQGSFTAAFQASEAGLRSGEKEVQGWGSRPTRNDQNTFYEAAAEDRWTNAIVHDKSDAIFLVEEKGFMRDSLDTGREAEKGRDFYMVFSQGEDASGNAEVVLESTYARRFD